MFLGVFIKKLNEGAYEKMWVKVDPEMIFWQHKCCPTLYNDAVLCFFIDFSRYPS